MEGEVRESSIVYKDVQPLAKDKQYLLPTSAIVVILIVALVVLKGFVYIKDKKYHGK